MRPRTEQVVWSPSITANLPEKLASLRDVQVTDAEQPEPNIGSVGKSCATTARSL